MQANDRAERVADWLEMQAARLTKRALIALMLPRWSVGAIICITIGGLIAHRVGVSFAVAIGGGLHAGLAWIERKVKNGEGK